MKVCEGCCGGIPENVRRVSRPLRVWRNGAWAMLYRYWHREHAPKQHLRKVGGPNAKS